MTRAQYETEANLEKERQIAEWLAGVLDVKLVKLGVQYPIDYASVDDSGYVTGLYEIKYRKYSWAELNSFGGVMLSSHKVKYAEDMSKRLKVPFYFVVCSNEDIVRMTDKMHGSFKLHGRRDRNDPSDLEPCLIIPLDLFWLPK